MATRTNNLKLSKAETSDAVRSTLTANNNNFDKLDDVITRLRANQISGTASGTEIEIADSANMESVLKVSGNSVQETRSGKNLLPQELFTTAKTIGGVTFTPNEDGSVKISGTATSTETKVYLTYNLLNKLAVGKTYISSIGQTVAGVKLMVEEDKNGSWVAFISNNINVAWKFNGLTTGNRVRVAMYVANGTTVDTTIYPQIEESSTATSYESYGAMPSPEFESPIMSVSGDVEARVEGKNLLDMDSWSVFDKQEDGSYLSNEVLRAQQFEIDLPINVYTLSYSIKTDASVDSRYRLAVFYEDGTSTVAPSYSTGEYISTSLTTKAKKISYIRFDYNKGASNTYLKDVMLEEGTVVTPYQEGPKKVQLPLGDIELRSTPDGTRDTFARVDGVWNKVSNVGSTVFNGSESWGFVSNSVMKFRTMINGAKALTSHESIPPNIYCQFFKTTAWYDAIVETIDEVISVAPSSSDASKTIRIKYNEMADLATFKAWLSAHPMEVIYPLASPIYTPITDPALISALDELEQLVLHKGYNRITVTGVNGVKAYLDLNYYKDINIVLDNINAKLGGV